MPADIDAQQRKRFLVRFKSGDEQPVVAAQGIEDEDCLIFLDSKGELAAFFDLTVVETWYETD